MINQELSLETRLATPFIWYPGQDPEEAQIESQLMIERSLAISAFISGQITWDDFLCLLEEHGIDAADAHDGWEEGLIYL